MNIYVTVTVRLQLVLKPKSKYNYREVTTQNEMNVKERNKTEAKTINFFTLNDHYYKHPYNTSRRMKQSRGKSNQFFDTERPQLSAKTIITINLRTKPVTGAIKAVKNI